MKRKTIEYFVEPVHRRDWGKTEYDFAALVTVSFLAQWASHYTVRFLGNSRETREGVLPKDPNERQLTIRHLFDWMNDTEEESLLHAISFRKGKQWLLDWYDGMFEPLHLTTSEFAQLQDEWERHGLPRDFYYPKSEQKSVVEPVRMFDSLVRSYVPYSPLEWAERDEAAIDNIKIPTDEERVERFTEECNTFMMALTRRMREIREPGNIPDEKEQALMARLIVSLRLLIKRARGGGLELLDEFVQSFVRLSDTALFKKD